MNEAIFVIECIIENVNIAIMITSNCQCAACNICFAWSRAHPAAKTNWLIITCSLNESIITINSIQPKLTNLHNEIMNCYYGENNK